MSAKKRKSTTGESSRRSKTAGGLMLSMSPSQRAALLRSYRLVPRVKKKIETATKESPRFTKNELCLILEEIVDPSPLDSPATRALLAPLRERIVETLEQDNPEAFGGEYLRGLDGARGTDKLFFQFRIELLDTQPAIWRRIQVADGPLASMHYAIQGAFDWEDDHLHQFEIGGLRFAPSPEEFFDFGAPTEDEDQVAISQLLPSSGKQTVWLYTYDFGDDWVHEVVFEGCGPVAPRTKYPVCVEGHRAAPPEDCGGPWGFADILQALTEGDGERDDDLLEWLGPFDPEAFDAQKATKTMRRWARFARRR
jgi:hypothetical protein